MRQSRGSFSCGCFIFFSSWYDLILFVFVVSVVRDWICESWVFCQLLKMGKISVWIYIKSSCSCDSFTYFYFYFQEVSGQQILGGFALWLLGSLSYCVSRVAFKGGFTCPSLCESAFNGQSLSLFRLRHILHKAVLSLFFDRIFLMHVRFFWAKSHSLCQHWTTNLALFFF